MHQMFKASLMLLGFAFLLVNGEEAQTDLTQGEFRDKVHLWADHKRTQKEIGEHLKWAPERQDWPSLPAHDKGYWRELSAAVISLLQLPSTALQAAFRHPDVQERLVKDRWDAVIFKDADDKNPYKLMAIIEMLTGLKTELGFKKDIVSEDAMGTWLGKLVVSSSADDHRTVQPPLFAFNTDEGLRPLLSNGDGTYVVKDCRALSESITTDENADPQGLNVQWSATKLYDSTTWFVRMNPSQALFAFANSASGVSKITGVDMKPFHDYWTE
ncbi:hypothetical protein QFC21_006357 [Naganishia friedmannii]|uniref:Uncharacterized protein n=1 Tax=Naganishia friedmannii TaxID=89922 RepID=A0ACC2V3G1_9TREE|nr:hypothetical protein QFC21_006357 [Naganishia friedmannii]